jgi:hypothetical protein
MVVILLSAVVVSLSIYIVNDSTHNSEQHTATQQNTHVGLSGLRTVFNDAINRANVAEDSDMQSKRQAYAVYDRILNTHKSVSFLSVDKTHALLAKFKRVATSTETQFDQIELFRRIHTYFPKWLSITENDTVLHEDTVLLDVIQAVSQLSILLLHSDATDST